MAILFAGRVPLEVDERFVRASGPGGQNVNKVATAVELRFDVGASQLTDPVKTRLLKLAGKKIIGDGILLIDSREYRTQAENRAAARARLINLIEQATTVPKSRTATKPKRSAREKRLQSKKLRSEVKRRRTRVVSD